MIEINKIYQEDCLYFMKQIPDDYIDLILQDPPYNITECEWESDITSQLDNFWTEWKRILKPGGTIVFVTLQPLTSKLIMSNLKMFKYEWIWNKLNATGHLNAKARPMKQHETIIIFSEGSATSTALSMCYNPQGLIDKNKNKINYETETTGKRESRRTGTTWTQTKTNYPKSILSFPYDRTRLHPTQKPVALFEYLVRTYSNENDIVFDGFVGSGTTVIACKNTNRNFICCEINSKYVEISMKRMRER